MLPREEDAPIFVIGHLWRPKKGRQYTVTITGVQRFGKTVAAVTFEWFLGREGKPSTMAADSFLKRFERC